jgi:methylmalonyl-CoA/ethylmalonyl-CoA epimerase
VIEMISAGIKNLFRVSGRRMMASGHSDNAAMASALKVGRLNHVAIAVPDLAKSSALYRNILGAHVSAPEDLPEHGVTTVFVNLANTKIELLHPFGQNSPISNFLTKNPRGGVHHVCLEVPDVDAAIQEMVGKGITVLSKEAKIGAHGKPVVFIHPKEFDGVLVELEQV